MSVDSGVEKRLLTLEETQRNLTARLAKLERGPVNGQSAAAGTGEFWKRGNPPPDYGQRQGQSTGTGYPHGFRRGRKSDTWVCPHYKGCRLTVSAHRFGGDDYGFLISDMSGNRLMNDWQYGFPTPEAAMRAAVAVIDRMDAM